MQPLSDKNPACDLRQQVLPDELKGRNWGGFLLPLFWGSANRVWIGLIPVLGIVYSLLSLVLGPALPDLGNAFGPLSLGVSFYLLLKGNELAWRSGRRWESVEQFRKVQTAWARVGLIVNLLIIALAIWVYLHAASAGIGAVGMG
ncbi:MAG TPA: hypothetical protein VKU00_03365 [Chthonomonadaceae bacterium]|nr:hypothetical protein [Chthonomonadaceae bacterium]